MNVRHLLRALAVAWVLLSAPAELRAAILYTQTPDFPPNNFNFYTSTNSGPDFTGFRVFDNFRLAQTSDVTSVTWQGLYFDFVNTGNNPVNPATVNWNIAFFASNPANGLPSTALQTTILPAAAVTTTLVANVFIFTPTGNVPVRLLQFRADLPTAFVAQENVQYWFSPFSLQPTFNPLFGWTSSRGGDNVTVQQNLASGNLNIIQDRDRAFTLEGTAVPEPSTWVLLGLGALGLAGYRARARRRAAQATA